MNDKLSVICVYNNEKCLKDYLLKGLKTQTEIYELILLDNRKSEYPSASSALNIGARKATGDLLVFSHQDILMEDDSVLANVRKYLSAGYSFAGSSGVGKFKAKMLSNVFTGSHDMKVFANSNCKRINDAISVETLDECFFCMTRDTYNALGGFDEKTCNNWHMYAVDSSYTAKEKEIGVYAIPVNLLHASGGKISKAFIRNLYKVARKHHLFWISAPCYHFVAFYPFMWCLWLFWQINYYLKNKTI